MAVVNFFAGGGIDRLAERRGDEAWLAARLGDPRSRFVPVWRARSLMVMGERPAAVFLDGAAGAALAADGALVVFLGLLDDRAHFAVDLSPHDDPAAAGGLPAEGEFHDLRTTGGLLDQRSGALLAYARGLMHWHGRHLYCGLCGSPTKVAEAGHVRVCTDPACATQHFPRTDPAVIMLVSHGESCLMGRSAHFPPGIYSTLAGFVEPGESLEEAVAREVMEETGVAIEDVRYHSSQPWPFPGSIMLGFHAVATSTRIDIDRNELEDARWFSRDELRDGSGSEGFRLPRPLSIARRLVDDWLAESA